MRPVGSAEELERRRHLAVQRVLEGYDCPEVADFLGVNPGSVRRWVRAFRTGGDSALAARPAPGRTPKLPRTLTKVIARWLAEPPSQHGFPTDLWSAPRLAQLIERDLDITLNPDHLGTWLRRHDFTPQKPRRVARERDDREVTRWLSRDWPRILDSARKRKARLMLLDESGLLMAPLLRRSWAPKGHPPRLEQKGKHREKVSVAAGLILNAGQDEVSLAYQTLANGFFDNELVADFLAAVKAALPGRLAVVWDRGPMHAGDPIEELQQRLTALEVEALPPYSPGLMPVEHLWRCLKHGRLCNFAPTDARQLDEAIVREMDRIGSDPVLLASFFHLSDLPLRALLI
jgi:transposase